MSGASNERRGFWSILKMRCKSLFIPALAGLALFFFIAALAGGCGGWNGASGTPEETSRPSVINVSPADNARDVAVTRIVAATFGAAMDPSTIDALSFTLSQGEGFVAGDVAYYSAAKTAYFSPRDRLKNGSLYTATITVFARDLSGNSMADNFAWTFTTASGSPGVSDTTSPTVVSTVPSNTLNGVLVNQKLTVTFSEAMDPSTIGAASFTLKNITAGGTAVAGDVSCSGTIAVFLPAASLEGGALYSARVSTFARDLAGNALPGDFTWTFTTASATTAVDDVMGEYPGNPALDPEERAYYPCVLFDGALYRMWYDDGYGQLRYAASSDGVNWAAGVPVSGLSNARHPVVESVDGKYMIWYWDAGWDYTLNSIRTAESTDGISWTLDAVITQVGTSVINTGWNSGGRGFGDVFYNPAGSSAIVPPVDAASVWRNKFVMYYLCSYNTGLAVSADGRLWHGYNDGAAPIFAPEEAGAWDSGAVSAGTVIKIGGAYHMWYSGGQSANNEGIGHAQSEDGIIWARSADSILNRNNGVLWRNVRTYTPAVIYDPGFPGFKMWYTGLDSSGNYSVGYATLNSSGDSLRDR